MSEPIEQLETTLKQANYSLTQPRRAVFEALQNTEPVTMHELIAICSNTDRASVYRTITLFEQLGIVQRLQIGWKYKLELTDSFMHHHHHLTCVRCGKVTPLPEDEILEARLRKLAQVHNFQTNDHLLELRGICAECQITSTTSLA